jgi:glutamyl-tRNA synthetase
LEAVTGSRARRSAASVSRARWPRPAAGPDPAGSALCFETGAVTRICRSDVARYFYATPQAAPEQIAEHVNDASRPALIELRGEFAKLPWRRDAIATALRATATRHQLKPPQIMMAVRVLVAGTPTTPAIDAVLALLDRDIVRARMASGLGLKRRDHSARSTPG